MVSSSRVPKEFTLYDGLEVRPDRHATYRMRRCVRELAALYPADLNRASLLDIGCNHGQLCYHLRSLYPEADLHGVDFYRNDVHGGAFHYEAMDASRAFTLPEERFDVVFALEILEHMIDTDFFLEEVRRILKPGGWLVITTPNICGYRNRWRVALGLYPHFLEYRQKIQHVRMYNKAKLVAHLSERGFRVRKCSGVNLLPEGLVETNPGAARFSDLLSDAFPSLAMSLMVIAQVEQAVEA